MNIEYETLKADLDKKNENITGLKGVYFELYSNFQLRNQKRTKRKNGTIKSMRDGKSRKE